MPLWGGGAERALTRQVLLLLLSHVSGEEREEREIPRSSVAPKVSGGEMPWRFELPTPAPAPTHTLARSIKGRPSSLVRTRHCQAPAPAQPRSNTAQPGTGRGTERGLRMRVSRADASLWTCGSTSRTRRRAAPPAQGACAPLPLTRGDYLGTLNPVPKPRWGRLTQLFSNPGLAKEPRT